MLRKVAIFGSNSARSTSLVRNNIPSYASPVQIDWRSLRTAHAASVGKFKQNKVWTLIQNKVKNLRGKLNSIRNNIPSYASPVQIDWRSLRTAHAASVGKFKQNKVWTLNQSKVNDLRGKRNSTQGRNQDTDMKALQNAMARIENLVDSEKKYLDNIRHITHQQEDKDKKKRRMIILLLVIVLCTIGFVGENNRIADEEFKKQIDTLVEFVETEKSRRTKQSES